MSKTIKTSSKGVKRTPKAQAVPQPNLNASQTKSSAVNFRAALTTGILLGLVIIISTILNFLARRNSDFREPVDISLRDPDLMRLGVGNADYNADGVPDVMYYPDPNLSSKDQNFCKGVGAAESCVERPLHPIYESMRLLGTPIPEKQKKRKYTSKETQQRFWFFDW